MKDTQMLLPLAFLATILVACVAVGYAIKAHRKAKKFERDSENRVETISDLYEQIYIAQQLTGFVDRLRQIEKKHPSHRLRLKSIVNDFDYYSDVVERPAGHRYKLKLVTLDDVRAKDELKSLRRAIRKNN